MMMSSAVINTVLITAAGSSQRFGEKKEYLILNDGSSYSTITVVSQCVYAFFQTGLFSRFIITVPKGEIEKVHNLLTKDIRLKDINDSALVIIEGGKNRQESVYKGLCSLKTHTGGIVLVHDGARPWVPQKLIADILEAVKMHGAAVPAIPVTDTQKEIDETGKIVRHLQRSTITAVQTPQGFFFDKLLYAHSRAQDDGRIYTDDSEIYASYCGDVYTCEGSRENRKITYREDMKSFNVFI